MLGRAPDEPVVVAAFARASRALADAWAMGDDHPSRRDRDYHNEQAIATRVEEFLMRASPASALTVAQPLVDAVNGHPREVFTIIQGITGIEDRRPNTAQFWTLWQQFAAAVAQSGWALHLRGNNPRGQEMLSAIFLTSYWKDDVRHWRSVEGYAHHVHGLFETLPATSAVLDAYLRFLYHIGEESLPEAFIRIAESLQRGDAPSMLQSGNTVFLLEVLLQRYVYGRPSELKRDPLLRKAVLNLLDMLVEAGSSAAFRMRDDFVTPTPAT